MVYLIFDLETTGLPETGGWGKYYNFKDVTKYNNSRVLSICIYLYSDKGKELDKLYCYIKPDNFEDILDCTNNLIKNQQIHNISENIILTTGIKWKEILNNIQSLFQKAKLIIGHNVNFDVHVLCSELYRLGMVDLACYIFNKERFCTMENGKNITKIKGKYEDYKYPKLSELYQYIFNEEMIGSHNAEWDVINCAKCFFKMKT
jgi:DNA polymerase III epsilon subunit-like protein